MTLHMSAAGWLDLLGHFLSLSLLSIGGAITTVPEMHRRLVEQNAWLSDGQFNASIALAQAAPGPNVLFVALMGWNIGINAGHGLGGGWMTWVCAFWGMLLAMFGILLPSTTLTFVASRWGHKNRELRGVRAFKQGMAPVVVALLVATGWVMTAAHGADWQHLPLWLLTGAVALAVWRTRVHLLWLLAVGALAGALGWV